MNGERERVDEGMRDCMDRSDEVFGGNREGEQAEEVCWSGRLQQLERLMLEMAAESERYRRAERGWNKPACL